MSRLFARRGDRHDAAGPERPAPGNQTAPRAPAHQPVPKLPRYLRRASASAGPVPDDARLSQPGDPEELEADRMAERALSAVPAAAAASPPAGAAPPPPGAGSPPAGAGSPPAGAGASDAPDKTWRKTLTRPAPPPAAAERSVPGGGRPLSAAERSDFEPRFGADLGQVRLHDGPQAAAAARSIRARAYTSGSDVVFAASEFAPASREGRQLLAHELAHVLQQGAGERRLARRVDGDVRSISVNPAWAEALSDTELDEQLDILRREMPGLVVGSTERQVAEANLRVLRADALRRHGGAGGAPRCGGGGPYGFIGPEAAPDAAAPAPTRVSVSLPGAGGAPAVSETVEVFEPFDAALPIVLYAIPIELTNLGGAEGASCTAAAPGAAEGERSPGIGPSTFPFPGVPPVTPSTVTADGRTLAVERVTDAYVIVSEYHHLAVGAGALTVLETAHGVRLIDAGRGGPGILDSRISGSLAPLNGCGSSPNRSESMTRRTRRNHTPAFKAQVALAALKSDKTLTELAQQYDIHPNQITDWKRQLTERAVQVFGDTSGPASSDPDLTKLHAKIGQLTLEKDFLEHALTKAGLLSARR